MGETTLQPWPCWQVPAQINHMGSTCCGARAPARGAVVVWCFVAVTSWGKLQKITFFMASFKVDEHKK